MVPPSEPQSLFALGRASLTYALGGFAYKGVALLSVPILARLLSPAELGLLDFAAVLASLVGLTAAVGSEQAIAYLEPRAADVRRIWGSALGVVAMFATVLVILIAVAAGPLAAAVVGDRDQAPLVTASAGYGVVVALTVLALTAVRLHGSPRAYALASFAIVTAEMAAAVTVAAVAASPVVLMVVAWAAAATVIAIPVLVRFAPRPSAPDPATMRRLATYGLPLVPAAIAWLVGDAAIRGALARFAEPAALGEYGVASRLVSVLALAVTGFGVAWHPYIYRSPTLAVAERASHALPRIAFVLLVGAAGLTLLAPELIAIIAGDPYLAARTAIPPMAVGVMATGVVVLVGAVVGASGSTRRMAAAALLGAGTQLVVAPAAVGSMGLAGAAWTSLLGAAVAAAFLLAGMRSLWRNRAGVIGLGVLLLAVLLLGVGTSAMGLPLALRVVAVTALSATGLLVLRRARLPTAT